MKKPLMVLLSALLTSVSVAAQTDQKTASVQHYDSSSKGASGKPTNILGKVGIGGKTLIADKDNRIWKVSNPEALNSIDGLRVKAKVRVNAAESEIYVMSVWLASEEHTGVRLHDSAFRR